MSKRNGDFGGKKQKISKVGPNSSCPNQSDSDRIILASSLSSSPSRRGIAIHLHEALPLPFQSSSTPSAVLSWSGDLPDSGPLLRFSDFLLTTCILLDSSSS